MKIGISNINTVKEKILSLRGETLLVKVNKGRNKIVTLNVIIDKVYPSMFVIIPLNNVELDRKSFSYNDVLCGDIKFINEMS